MRGPETLDATIDPKLTWPAKGTITWGSGVATRCSPNVLGRYTTLRSFLSQWSKVIEPRRSARPASPRPRCRC